MIKKVWIGLTLGILIFLSLINVLFGNWFGSTQIGVGVDSSSLLNGSASTYVIENVNYDFGVSTLTGIITLIVIMIGIIAILGLNIVGSGLNSDATRILSLLTVYITLWTVFSFLTYNLIVSIETFGIIIWISLTIGYTYGVIKKINSG